MCGWFDVKTQQSQIRSRQHTWRRNISTNTAAEEKKYAKTDQLILFIYYYNKNNNYILVVENTWYKYESPTG